MEYIENPNVSYIEPPKKEVLKIQIPYVLRFSLIWVIFFAIIGIVIQSFQAETFVFPDTISNFFAEDYVAWVQSFGSFTDVTVYGSNQDLVYALAEKWYYFFLTGGYLSLLWGLISWIINGSIVISRRRKQARAKKEMQAYKTMQNQPQQAVIIRDQPYIIEEKPAESVETNKIKEEKIDENREKINEWLQEGLLLLSQGNLEEAEMIYNSLRQEYNPESDAYGALQRRILAFYEEIVAEKKEREQ